MASTMTLQLFERSDELEQRVTHLVQNYDVLKVHRGQECVRNLEIAKHVTDMKLSVEGTDKCLLKEASKNARLETDLTALLNNYQAKSVRGRKAMKKCNLGTVDVSDCLERLKDEMQSQRTQTRASIEKIQKGTISRLRRQQIWMGVCTFRATKFVRMVENKLRALVTCQQTVV